MMKLVTIKKATTGKQFNTPDVNGVIEHLTLYLKNGWEIVSVTTVNDESGSLAVVLQNSPPKYASR